jgi:ABC-type phosphate transport system substrate-binding protein
MATTNLPPERVQSMKGITRMSDTTSAPTWGARAVKAGLLALTLTALAAIGLAPTASADFTTGKCAGPSIIGEGGSFATAAHVAFNNTFKNIFCNGTPGQGTINVEYRPNGSGAGVASMKARTVGGPRFGGTDDPPTPTEVQEMEAGTAATGDEGKLHVFPIAVGSVVALVNFPNGCTSPETELPAANRTPEEDLDTDAVPDDVIRVRFTKEQFEKIWAQGASGVPYVTWHDVFSGLQNTATCGQEPIVRVVRFDQSGTSFAFKDYLNAINGSRGWKTTFATVAPVLTRQWPGATFGARTDCSGSPEGPGAGLADNSDDHLTSACAKGNPELIAKLVATDGSVGYADLATSREKGLSITPEANDNDTYWTQVENGSGQFTEPTSNPKAFRTGGITGSNCGSAVFSNVPANSYGSWANTSGVNATAGWGICTLTYALVFDDNAAVWKATPEEEQKARTVKDYEEAIVSDTAQGTLPLFDYAVLPAGLLSISRQAVSEIGWNKSGSSVVTPPTETPKGTPPGTTPGPGAKPSNRFSVPRTTISSKKGTATFSVKLPGAGKLDVLGTAKNKGKKINVGHLTLTVSKAGTYSLTLKPSGAAKALLSENGKLKVTLKFTFTPTGGDANALPSSVTLKLDQDK